MGYAVTFYLFLCMGVLGYYVSFAGILPLVTSVTRPTRWRHRYCSVSVTNVFVLFIKNKAPARQLAKSTALDSLTSLGKSSVFVTSFTFLAVCQLCTFVG